MPTKLDVQIGAKASHGSMGATVHAVADRLTDHGLDVSGPVWDESERLSITNARDAVCEIMIYQRGFLTWEYYPLASNGVDPADVSDKVTAVLGAGDAEHTDMDYKIPRGLPLKSTVGRALRIHGLDISLAVYEDRCLFEVSTELVVINPARPERGRVRVSDYGTITWECGASAMAGGIEGISATEFAETVARALATAERPLRTR